MLVCDPHMQVTGGQVRLLQNGTLLIESIGLPPVGNIPEPAANLLFSQSLLIATQLADTTTQHLPLFANLISSRMFLEPLGGTNSTPLYKPLSPDAIGRNMNIFVLSASKAFVDGYSPENATKGDTFVTMPVQASVQEEVMALTASETLLIITIVLSLLAVLLVTALCVKLPESLQLFNLETITRKLEAMPRMP